MVGLLPKSVKIHSWGVPEVPEVVLTHPSPPPILIPLLGSELPIGELPQNTIHFIPLGGCGKIFSNFLMLNDV